MHNMSRIEKPGDPLNEDRKEASVYSNDDTVRGAPTMRNFVSYLFRHDMSVAAPQTRYHCRCKQMLIPIPI